MFPMPATDRWSSSTALTGARRPASTLGEDARGEPRAERLVPERAPEVRLELRRLEEQPRPEAADVAIRDVRAVV